MKTKITTAAFFLIAGICNAQAQNSWKPAVSSSQFIEAPAEKPMLSRTETHLGAHMSYDSKGGTVTNIVINSPAQSAGLKTGDIITAIGSVTINSEASFEQAMNTYKPGEKVSISFIRKGTAKQKKVTLDKITVFKNS